MANLIVVLSPAYSAFAEIVAWIKSLSQHISTMEYYSAIERNEIELFVMRWTDLESVIQNEVSQKEKNKYRMLTHIHGI